MDCFLVGLFLCFFLARRAARWGAGGGAGQSRRRRRAGRSREARVFLTPRPDLGPLHAVHPVVRLQLGEGRHGLGGRAEGRAQAGALKRKNGGGGSKSVGGGSGGSKARGRGGRAGGQRSAGQERRSEAAGSSLGPSFCLLRVQGTRRVRLTQCLLCAAREGARARARGIHYSRERTDPAPPVPPPPPTPPRQTVSTRRPPRRPPPPRPAPTACARASSGPTACA